jgi:hypothetical protein
VDGSGRRLNDLSTSWTLLRDAHDPAADAARRTEARQELLLRYVDVARRYLGGALRGEPRHDEVIDELLSDFGVRVMEGRLHNASAGRGRFRDYLRTALSNLVRDHRRKKQSPAAALGGSRRWRTCARARRSSRGCGARGWCGAPCRRWRSTRSGPARSATPCCGWPWTTRGWRLRRWRSGCRGSWGSP